LCCGLVGLASKQYYFKFFLNWNDDIFWKNNYKNHILDLIESHLNFSMSTESRVDLSSYMNIIKSTFTLDLKENLTWTWLIEFNKELINMINNCYHELWNMSQVTSRRTTCKKSKNWQRCCHLVLWQLKTLYNLFKTIKGASYIIKKKELSSYILYLR